MPDAPRLPAHPSFAQLQKQAKELLHRYRAGDPDAAQRLLAAGPRLFDAGARAVTLADAQFALARELGFESWAALKHQIEAPRPGGLDAFERIARDLADAYTSGDAQAIRRINWCYGTSFACDFHEIVEAQRQLPAWFAAAARTPGLALADTRRMIAHAYGFSEWDSFAEHFTSAPASPRGTPPVFHFEDDGTLHVSGPLSTGDWDSVAAAMKERGIESLCAGGISDAALARLSHLDHLTDVDFDGSTELSDAGLKLLANFPRLRSLNLSGVKGRITDRGLEILRHLPALARIHLCWQANITDAGVAGLACCDRLEAVDLMGTPTGDGAVRALVGKPLLRTFKSGRNVTDAGLALLREFPVFKTWRGGKPRYSLMSADPGPNHLSLDGPFTGAGIETLRALEGLFALSFFWHCSFRGGDLAPLKQLPHLGVLGCGGERCDDAAMRHIAAFPRLRQLIAQGTVASDAGFTALARSQTLEHIWGRECPNLSGVGFKALASMPRLTGLAVSCRNVDDTALASLPRFHALRELLPMDVHDRGFRHIGGCESLESLWCMYCRDTGDEATEHIAALRLKSYYAGQTRITDRSLGILARMSSLERLELRACPGLTDAGVAHLAGLPKLRELTLASLPGVTPQVAARFAAGVRVRFT